MLLMVESYDLGHYQWIWERPGDTIFTRSYRDHYTHMVPLVESRKTS